MGNNWNWALDPWMDWIYTYPRSNRGPCFIYVSPRMDWTYPCPRINMEPCLGPGSCFAPRMDWIYSCTRRILDLSSRMDRINP